MKRVQLGGSCLRADVGLSHTTRGSSVVRRLVGWITKRVPLNCPQRLFSPAVADIFTPPLRSLLYPLHAFESLPFFPGLTDHIHVWFVSSLGFPFPLLSKRLLVCQGFPDPRVCDV